MKEPLQRDSVSMRSDCGDHKSPLQTESPDWRIQRLPDDGKKGRAVGLDGMGQAFDAVLPTEFRDRNPVRAEGLGHIAGNVSERTIRTDRPNPIPAIIEVEVTFGF